MAVNSNGLLSNVFATANRGQRCKAAPMKYHYVLRFQLKRTECKIVKFGRWNAPNCAKVVWIFSKHLNTLRKVASSHQWERHVNSVFCNNHWSSIIEMNWSAFGWILHTLNNSVWYVHQRYGPRPKTNPSTDHFQYTRRTRFGEETMPTSATPHEFMLCAHWSLPSRCHPQDATLKDPTQASQTRAIIDKDLK